MQSTALRVIGILCLQGLALIGAVPASTQSASAQSSRPSATVCDSYARNYANQNSRQGQVLGRAAGGSLIGLGLGALAGASGVGAAIGATVGVIGGGARREQTAAQMYQAAYQDCMNGNVR